MKLFEKMWAKLWAIHTDFFIFICKIMNKCEECNGTRIYKHPYEDSSWKCICCKGTGKFFKK